MKAKFSTSGILLLSAVAVGGWFAANAWKSAGAAGTAPPAAITTFSTANIGRQGHIYVGGKWAGAPGKETMDGAMYVEVWVPKEIRHPYPVVFATGGGGQGAYSMIETPDARPGWAYDFVNQGYTVYLMDFPATGRSAYNPELDGTITPPRSGPLMEEVWSLGRPAATPQSSWPQSKKYTQWPSEAANKGKMGDPVFDYFAKTELQGVSTPNGAQIIANSVEQLLDMIGQPVILMVNSGTASSGWVAADARPKLIKGILAAEPVAPPIENAERGSTGPGRLWGVSNLPLHYVPEVKEPSELKPVREDKADGPDLIPCWVQQEPAHKLTNLANVPVLEFSGEASYHRPYSHCVAKWLNQAGVKTTFVRLEDVGLPGNGHQMMSEKNSAGISKFMMSWLDKNVH